MSKLIVGILGAGKLGMTLAKLGLDAGYQVNIAGSKDPAKIVLATSVLAPGAQPMYVQDVIEKSDIIFLALPLSKYQNNDAKWFAGKTVVDSMNYWWEIDGKTSSYYYDEQQTSSEKVQAYLSDSIVVKAFNHMGYHDLADGAHKDRVIVYAGTDETALAKIKQIIIDFGFVPYYIGDLHATSQLQPSGVLFGADEDMAGIKRLLNK
ncbi:NADPH-dependent F420 reductase [Companilactobacillus sp. HBUAS56275]|uniref:NAD(P)-binding domain-containing protein n=1 Tax=Candidatus Companilactobacillus pullicola TaxID=2838523 RepID=A0A9D2CNM8_9LACO|nr:NAD(P)-binding domain-containing protein [Candidatus Companilactobacillus pullicola]